MMLPATRGSARMSKLWARSCLEMNLRRSGAKWGSYQTLQTAGDPSGRTVASCMSFPARTYCSSSCLGIGVANLRQCVESKFGLAQRRQYLSPVSDRLTRRGPEQAIEFMSSRDDGDAVVRAPVQHGAGGDSARLGELAGLCVGAGLFEPCEG